MADIIHRIYTNPLDIYDDHDFQFRSRNLFTLPMLRTSKDTASTVILNYDISCSDPQ